MVRGIFLKIGQVAGSDRSIESCNLVSRRLPLFTRNPNIACICERKRNMPLLAYSILSPYCPKIEKVKLKFGRKKSESVIFIPSFRILS